MRLLLQEVRHNPLLWLLAFVPVVFVEARMKPEAHTLLFVLSVLAIVPLATLLSHATESVAAKTGDAAGGLLNATLGNLTELVIALTALRAGQYTLVKASSAGAIFTNTLFMLGASFLLGGLKHHIQEYNRVSARMQAGLLFLATVALLIPSAMIDIESAAGARFSQTLSLGLAVLLIVAYALGMLFSLKTHREVFASAAHGEDGEAPWPIGLALAGVTVLVAGVNRPRTDGPAVLAGRRGDDAHRHGDGHVRHGQRALGLVRRRTGADGLPDLRHDAESVAAPGAVDEVGMARAHMTAGGARR